MINKKLFRICPVCGHDIGEILYNQKFSLPVENPLPKNYDVVSCISCGFVFADSSATQKNYDVYYEQLSKYEDETTASGTGLSSFDAARLNKTALEIEKILPDKSAKILDVGAANGGLLMALRVLGYEYLTGLDPSLECVSKMQSQGLRAMTGGIFSSAPLNEKFDCIVLTHVLEHVRDIQKGMENLLRLLNDDGIMYIEIPNAAAYGKYFIVPFYYFDCEHINHFDKASIKNLLNTFGGVIIELQDKEILVSATRLYPALGVFYKKDIQRVASRIIPDFIVKQSVLKHIEQSSAVEQNKQLEELEKKGTPIVVWGAGQYTQRLLANTNLGVCNILAFVDNDSKKIGLRLGASEIQSKEILKDFKGPIIIASALYGSDILKEIRSMDLNNQVIII